MAEHILETDGFTLSFGLSVFETDLQYAVNTILSVLVKSGGFSASAKLDIDIRQFIAFIKDLQSIYDTLAGSAKLEEPYGFQQYISFAPDKTEHITVKGYLCDGRKEHELYFHNVFDQTCLKDFAEELFFCCSTYNM